MPVRKVKLERGEYYHVLNRGSGKRNVFINEGDYLKFIEIIKYYQNDSPGVSLSNFVRLTPETRLEIEMKMKKKKNYLIDLIAYCLMPNHFHLLVRQNEEDGIMNFMHRLQNSYSHYFNLKRKDSGVLFEGRFKAIRVNSEEQLLHLSRYVHLNPYSSGLVKSLKGLLKYFYSSLPEYLGEEEEMFCQKKIILNQFKNLLNYKKFIWDQADYQRSLQLIKAELGE